MDYRFSEVGAWRALTIHRPHAGLIVRGLKTIEFRPTRYSHRGWLAIHAGLEWDASAGPTAFYLASDAAAGCIVGVAFLRSVHEASQACTHPGPPPSRSGRLSRWHHVLTRHLALAEPIPCRGAQGLWRVPPLVAAQLQASLATDRGVA